MIEFVLILTLCRPGAWNNCAGDKIIVERIANIPTQAMCDEIREQYMKVKYTEGGVVSAICIPQMKKDERTN